jgi:hypothetical protein
VVPFSDGKPASTPVFTRAGFSSKCSNSPNSGRCTLETRARNSTGPTSRAAPYAGGRHPEFNGHATESARCGLRRTRFRSLTDLALIVWAMGPSCLFGGGLALPPVIPVFLALVRAI